MEQHAACVWRALLSFGTGTSKENRQVNGKGSLLERLRSAEAQPAEASPSGKGSNLLERLRSAEAQPAEAPPRVGVGRAGKYVVLDERHAVEQDAIADGKRFASGDYLVEIVRCYAVDGDPKIWLPEEGIGYFVAECQEISVFSAEFQEIAGPFRAAWVNRLRFNGPAQLKGFLIEAHGWLPTQHGRVTAALCAEVVSPKNPLAGVRLQLTVQPPMRSGYMHHRWTRYVP